MKAVVTDVRGAFRAEHLLPGDRCRFRAVRAGRAWTLTQWFPAGAADAHIMLPPESTLSGRVVDADGRPVGGAVVRLKIDEASTDPTATTSSDGTFKLFQLGSTAGDLVALVRDGGTTGRAKLAARRPGVRAADGPIQILLGRGAVIAGTVVDKSGHALEHKGVRAIPVAAAEDAEWEDWPSAWTDADGRFRIEGLEPGRYRLSEWHGDGGNGHSGPEFILTSGDDVGAGATDVRLTYVIAHWDGELRKYVIGR
jgi:hypothetical protein